ncbi:GMC family oxidoreductase [Frateuria aurantia]
MKSVDVVVVGMGWTGAIMARELLEAGLNVVALERGSDRTTADDAKFPKIADELAYSIRGKLFQDLSKETVTIRHAPGEQAYPYRQWGSFLLGTGVGGCGFHWNGLTWRPLSADLQIRSHTIERYGRNKIPDTMSIQDFPVTSEELEPYLDRFEKVCGVSGQAGNLNGQRIEGGNPFEEVRKNNYPLPPLKSVYGDMVFQRAAREAGFHPFHIPAANASAPYTNPYGVRLGPCNFCGYCEDYGCFMYSKASPQTTILPVLRTDPRFELRTQTQVIKVNLDSTGKRATGVTYVDALGRQVEQPADLVILSAFQMHNVRLLLLSGIGEAYDPVTGKGQVGRNYAYQTTAGSVKLFFDPSTHMNPFIGTGAGGQAIDDVNGDNIDHSDLDFIGGGVIAHHRTGGRPIRQVALPPGTPQWGSAWKRGYRAGYQHNMSLASQGGCMSYKDVYLDLDPHYRDAFGQPLLRMTFNWKPNEIRLSQFLNQTQLKIAKEIKTEAIVAHALKEGENYDTRVYQSTHNTGGAIMGSHPGNSVVNKYLQSWDVSNVFVLGASAFPQNYGYNPTGLVGALAYFAATAIREQYLKSPGPLVQA